MRGFLTFLGVPLDSGTEAMLAQGLDSVEAAVLLLSSRLAAHFPADGSPSSAVSPLEICKEPDQ